MKQAEKAVKEAEEAVEEAVEAVKNAEEAVTDATKHAGTIKTKIETGIGDIIKQPSYTGDAKVVCDYSDFTLQEVRLRTTNARYFALVTLPPLTDKSGRFGLLQLCFQNSRSTLSRP